MITVLCSFVIIFILFFNNPSTNYAFTLLGIIHFIVIFYSSNLVGVSIGICAGYFIKNELSTILTLLILGLFTAIPRIVAGKNDTLTALFSLYDDHQFIMTNTLVGILVNTSYLMDKLFLILLIITVALIVRFATYPKEKWLYSGLLLVVISSQLLILTNYSIPKFHYNYPTTLEQNYQIIEHNMNLTLSNKLKNQSTISLIPLEKTDTISLLLDDTFDVQQVRINEQTVSYQRSNHVVTIAYPFQAQQQVEVTIQYEGTVYIANNINFDTFYVSPLAINLPGDSFKWYPEAPAHTPINFNIKIGSSATIYSNLTQTQNFQFQGRAYSAHLFAGQYKIEEVDGIRYMLPINYQLSTIESYLQTILDSPTVSEEIKKVITDKTYQQLIVGIWPLEDGSDSIKMEGDTLLLNFI
ncbi:hypothetical protein [Bacillus ndiopicus]|uniref:hypothetical protein n=1 Tax=Bacillus ndiopicus TaxID=1347368 RepID=UPI0018A87525|nr:hypothetical protein [Bacillus ndiopicus]